MKICLTRFNNDTWTKHIQFILKESLLNYKDNVSVDSITHCPNENSYYDVLIICGIRSIIKDQVDQNKIKKNSKFICDMSDIILDKRTSVEDLTFYFVPSSENNSKKFKFLPKPINESFLYPEHEKNEPLTIFVDHFHAQNDAAIENSVLALQTIFHEIKLCPFKLRIFYQQSNGIVKNPLQPEIPFNSRKVDLKFLPFKEISKFYRKTHIFFPTHRETQGMVAQEIGMCGGITMMQPWMYPSETYYQFPKILYKQNDKIDWKGLKNLMSEKQIQTNRNHVIKHINFQNFKDHLFRHLNELLNTKL